MAGQDLLDQGRTGTVQAEYENRVRRLATRSAKPLEKGGRGMCHDIVRRPGDRHLVGVELLGPEGVSGRIMPERRFIVRPVLVGLSQREMDVQRLFDVEPGPKRLEHLGNVAGRELVGLEVGQRPIGLAERRLELGRPFQCPDRLVHPADSLQRVGEVHPDAGLVRFLPEHPLVRPDLLLVHAQRAQCLGFEGANLEPLAERRGKRLQLLEGQSGDRIFLQMRDQHNSPLGVRVCLHGPPKKHRGFLDPAVLDRELGELCQRIRIRRVLGEPVAEQHLRLDPVADPQGSRREVEGHTGTPCRTSGDCHSSPEAPRKNARRH